MVNDTLSLIIAAIGTALLGAGAVLIMSLRGAAAQTRAQATRFLIGVGCVLLASFLFLFSSLVGRSSWGALQILGLVLLVAVTGFAIVRARALVRSVRQNEQADASDRS
ncbi:hypothetical protein [Microbacterium sp. BDGP8]|uniref:hypothetical protein n=1 Tax=Microbacterium sp. BDGP8 TaxID=3035531 RepID=UPI00249DDAA0|nr:hypothetical protein [Microbacterium sp. BDGP8]WHE37819.1 hypothetical protein P6897_15940 [Microbacterium sp. BDGP8]